jgi:3-hydroxyisobutyrate dehydrogenase-like beta-hydroxyacid dehydrogenase
MAVGVVGVGRIGAPLVARLVAAGHDVVATDIRPERRSEVEKSGATWTSDLAALVSCDIVFTVLPGSPELQDLVLGDGFLSHIDRDAVWIDMTSASFELGAQLAHSASAQGVAYLDAPIGGGVPAMRAGEVTLYVGGDRDVLTASTPVLRSFATSIHHAGSPGMGYLTKLLINSLWFGHATLTAEALLVAHHYGQSPDRMRELLLGSAGDSAFVAHHLPALLDGDYLRDFGLDRCVEELGALEQTANHARTPHPVMSAVTELHRLALRRFGAVDGELMAVALLEEQAGIRLRREEPGQ